MKDLIVLVADGQQKRTLETLLAKRTQSLSIREIEFEVFSHPQKDPGVYKQAHLFLAPYHTQYQYSIIVLDSAWEGAPSADDLRDEIFSNVSRYGWEKRCEVIVIQPELEAWVWSNSSEVYKVLRITHQDTCTLGQKHGYWPPIQDKPSDPKALLKLVLRKQRRPLSASIFKALAESVSLNKCKDSEFLRFKKILKAWFGE